MTPKLYPSTETAFTSEGLGRLVDARKCEVTEERNGQYELVLEYPVGGELFDSIKPGCYIMATHDDSGVAQAFQIYKTSAPLDGWVTVNAWHISYLLNNIIVEPFTASTCANALAGLASNSMSTNPFSFTTDKTVNATFTLTEPASVRACLGGMSGSILDVYGTGEYEFNMLNVKLWLHRGTNTDVVIRYGKNLKSLDYQLDASNMFNAVVPYWTNDNTTVYVDHVVVRTGDTAKNVIALDLSSAFDEIPTQAQLEARAQTYIDASTNYVVKENIKVDFVPLWQTEEYKAYADLERVKLCDTVTIYYEKFNINATAKIIKVVYNTLLDRYSYMELGEPRTTLSQQIQADVSGGILAEVPAAVRRIIDESITTNKIILKKPDDGASAPFIYLQDDNGNDAGALYMNYYLRNGVYTPYRLYFREYSLSSSTNLPLSTRENYRLPAPDFDRATSETYDIWTTKTLPEAPSTPGAYLPKADVTTGGGVLYSWRADDGGGGGGGGSLTSVGLSNASGESDFTITGSPITTSGTLTIKHANTVTAQSTKALYPIAFDKHGHITGSNAAVTVPTKTSQLTNDSNFVDAAGAASAAPVQSVNGATGAVSLSAADVGALASNTTYVSSFNGNSGVITYTAPVSSVNGQTGAVSLSIPTKTSDLANDSDFTKLCFGTCSTAKATVQKEVSIANVTALTTGLTIVVKFTNTNTATAPTLKVNSLDAKSIMRYGTTAVSTSAATSWNAGEIVTLTYDGTNWLLNDFNNTTYSAMTQAEMQTGTATTGRTLTAARLKEAVEYHAPVKSVNGQTGVVTLSIPSVPANIVNTFNTQTGDVTVGTLTTADITTGTDTTSKLVTAKAIADALSGLGGGTVLSVGLKNATGESDFSINGSPITSTGEFTIEHANTTTAKTTKAVYPIAFDKHGHITASDAAVTIPTKVSDLNNDSGFVDAAGAASAAPVQSVNGKTGAVSISSIYWVEINGTVNWPEVATAIADNKTIIGYIDYGDGDVAYYVCVESIVDNATTPSNADGLEFACAGYGYILRASWYGGGVGWSAEQTFFVPDTRTVNGKALSSNISLTASDVGAFSTSGGTIYGDVDIQDSNLHVDGNINVAGNISGMELSAQKPDTGNSAPWVRLRDYNGNLAGGIFMNYYTRNGVVTPYRLYFREYSLSSTTNLPLTNHETFRLPAAEFDRSTNQNWDIWTTKTIPEPPSTNGTYTLKATVSGGVVTYSWT